MNPALDCSGDRVIDRGSYRGGSSHFGRNVSKPSVGFHQVDELHPHQGVQEAVQQHLCQHGHSQHGQDLKIKLTKFFISHFYLRIS